MWNSMESHGTACILICTALLLGLGTEVLTFNHEAICKRNEKMDPKSSSQLPGGFKMKHPHSLLLDMMECPTFHLTACHHYTRHKKHQVVAWKSVLRVRSVTDTFIGYGSNKNTANYHASKAAMAKLYSLSIEFSEENVRCRRLCESSINDDTPTVQTNHAIQLTEHGGDDTLLDGTPAISDNHTRKQVDGGDEGDVIPTIEQQNSDNRTPELPPISQSAGSSGRKSDGSRASTGSAGVVELATSLRKQHNPTGCYNVINEILPTRKHVVSYSEVQFIELARYCGEKSKATVQSSLEGHMILIVDVGKFREEGLIVPAIVFSADLKQTQWRRTIVDGSPKYPSSQQASWEDRKDFPT